MSIPSITYGAGLLPSEEDGPKTVELLKAHGVERIDTGRIYPESEKYLGNLGLASQFKITTKAAGWRNGTGKRDIVLASIEESFKELRTDKVDVYLLHSPDPTVPITETLDTIQEIYEQGKFKKFGFSNFSAAQVLEAYDYSKSKGYVLPTVYQANYNLVARKNETILFPTLRKLGFTIQAYSPIAGGFLAKTPEQITSPASSRWTAGNSVGDVYRTLYVKPEMLDYLQKFGELSKKSDISRVALAYRWTRYHSALGTDDTIIFSASSVKQLEETLKVLQEGPLDAWIVERLNEMWMGIEEVAPVDNYQIMLT